MKEEFHLERQIMLASPATSRRAQRGNRFKDLVISCFFEATRFTSACLGALAVFVGLAVGTGFAYHAPPFYRLDEAVPLWCWGAAFFCMGVLQLIISVGKIQPLIRFKAMLGVVGWGGIMCGAIVTDIHSLAWVVYGGLMTIWALIYCQSVWTHNNESLTRESDVTLRRVKKPDLRL